MRRSVYMRGFATSKSTPRMWDNRQFDSLTAWLSERRCQHVAFVVGSASAAALDIHGCIGRTFPDLSVQIVDGLAAGSPVSAVLRARELLLKFLPDAVVAIGGGSVIDAGKAAAALMNVNGSLSEEDVVAIWSSWPVELPVRSIPFIAVPTTAGTGTEATPYAVLSDRANNKLFGVSGVLQPDVAVMVPELVSSVPRDVIAELAFDAMAHAFEALWSTRATVVSDFAATSAIQLLDQHLYSYYSTPSDTPAARGVMLAATNAGEAFRLASSTACHAVSFPLATVLSGSHGHTCSLLLKAFAKENLRHVKTRRKLDTVARALGLHDASHLPGYIQSWRMRLGVAHSVALPQAIISHVSEHALAPMLANNPVMLEPSDICRILRSLAAA